MSRRNVSKKELRNHAARKVGEVLQLPRIERLHLLSRCRPRWRRPHIVQEFLEQSIPVVRDDPGEAFHRVELAGFVIYLHSESGAASIGGQRPLLGLQALLEAYYGNIERVLRRFPQAESHFAKADKWLAAGGYLDPADRARLASLRASLLADMAQLEEALRLLLRAHQWLEREDAEEYRLELSKIVFQQAGVLRLLGHPEEALTKYRESCHHLVASGETGLALRAILNLAFDYCDIGDTKAALATLKEGKALLRRCDDRYLLLWHTWLQGRIHEAQGAPYEARRCFLAAQRSLLERGDVYDALQVSLDLAGLALGRGHHEELQVVCGELEALMRHPQAQPLLHDEGRAALQRFILAAAQRNATPELLASTLTAMRHRPGHRVAVQSKTS